MSCDQLGGPWGPLLQALDKLRHVLECGGRHMKNICLGYPVGANGCMLTFGSYCGSELICCDGREVQMASWHRQLHEASDWFPLFSILGLIPLPPRGPFLGKSIQNFRNICNCVLDGDLAATRCCNCGMHSNCVLIQWSESNLDSLNWNAVDTRWQLGVKANDGVFIIYKFHLGDLGFGVNNNCLYWFCPLLLEITIDQERVFQSALGCMNGFGLDQAFFKGIVHPSKFQENGIGFTFARWMA